MTFATNLTERQKITALINIYSKEGATNSFAESIVRQYTRNRRLSDRQWAAVDRIIANGTLERRQPEQSQRRETPTASRWARKILETMQVAARSIQRPKVSLNAPGLNRRETLELSIAGERSRNAGAIYITDGGEYGSNTYYGKIDTAGRFLPSSSATDAVVDALLDFANDPAGAAAASGRRVGSCCFCRRALTDARSTSVGYGPICAENYGLPWGA